MICQALYVPSLSPSWNFLNLLPQLNCLKDLAPQGLDRASRRFHKCPPGWLSAFLEDTCPAPATQLLKHVAPCRIWLLPPCKRTLHLRFAFFGMAEIPEVLPRQG